MQRLTQFEVCVFFLYFSSFMYLFINYKPLFVFSAFWTGHPSSISLSLLFLEYQWNIRFWTLIQAFLRSTALNIWKDSMNMISFVCISIGEFFSSFFYLLIKVCYCLNIINIVIDFDHEYKTRTRNVSISIYTHSSRCHLIQQWRVELIFVDFRFVLILSFIFVAYCFEDYFGFILTGTG